jgi:hypothetical protein
MSLLVFFFDLSFDIYKIIMTLCQTFYCTKEKGKCEKNWFFFVITDQDYPCQLINADIIDDTDTVASWLFRKSFNCRYNPRMDYAFCLLALKSSEKWWSPLFGATCNFNDQILPYGILYLAIIPAIKALPKEPWRYSVGIVYYISIDQLQFYH